MNYIQKCSRTKTVNRSIIRGVSRGDRQAWGNHVPNSWSPITRRFFSREAFPRDDAQGYVSAHCDSGTTSLNWGNTLLPCNV